MQEKLISVVECLLDCGFRLWLGIIYEICTRKRAFRTKQKAFKKKSSLDRIFTDLDSKFKIAFILAVVRFVSDPLTGPSRYHTWHLETRIE